MKPQSWILLIVLATVVSFAAGLRQGVTVERRNITQQASLSKVVAPTTTPLVTQHFYQVFNDACGLQFVLPGNFSSDSAQLDVICAQQTSTTAAQLKENGYKRTAIASGAGELDVWIKSPPDLQLLIDQTIKVITPNE